VDRQVTVKEKEEDFYFPLALAPEIVRIDPEYALLAKTSFRLPDGLLYAQLEDSSDVIGRLLAVEQLAKLKDHEAVAKLKRRLNTDAFYGVRLEAAGALRAMHTDEALEALIASTEQGDARVRQRVMDGIGGFYHETAYATARSVCEKEKNPDIVARAIGAMAAYGKPEVRETLLRHLNSQSYKNSLVDAAIGAMRSQDDPGYLIPLRDCLERRESELTSHGFASGLEALASLARKEEKKDEWREFILRHVNHQKKAVQLAALAALGKLEDTRAIPVLEKFTRGDKDTPERQAAEQALAAVRTAKKPADDLRDLRNEVLELQKANRELKKEVEDLKKKVEAAGKPPARTKTRLSPPPGTRMGQRN
jgi:aminopeptidase N